MPLLSVCDWPIDGRSERLFLSEPVSIAEISIGQTMPLDRWPEDMIGLDSDVAGRRVTVCSSPTEDRVIIDVFSPDLIASLNLSDVVAVSAVTKPYGVRTMVVTLDEDIVTLRLRPDISVHYGAHADLGPS
jgi:hypothetical protein